MDGKNQAQYCELPVAGMSVGSSNPDEIRKEVPGHRPAEVTPAVGSHDTAQSQSRENSECVCVVKAAVLVFFSVPSFSFTFLFSFRATTTRTFFRFLYLCQAVKVVRKPACRCHGTSGSCTVKTCYKRLATLEELSLHLLKRSGGGTERDSRRSRLPRRSRISCRLRLSSRSCRSRLSCHPHHISQRRVVEIQIVASGTRMRGTST